MTSSGNIYVLCLESNVLLCDFHREQAWGRWLNATKNKMREKKAEALLFLRRIAASETHEDYLRNVNNLRESSIWMNEDGTQFRNWIEKIWLPKYQVYIKCTQG